MNSQADRQATPHQEACMLLPWYANGTLDGGQRALVEEHVRNCITCRRELLGEHRMLAAFASENAGNQSMRAGYERLTSRIAARSRARTFLPAAAGHIWSRFLQFARAFEGMRFRSALAALPVMVIAIAYGLTRLPQESLAGAKVYPVKDETAVITGYQTLSNQVAAIAHQDDVQVIFTPGTSIDAIETLLASVPASIVAGPTSAGVYNIRLLGLSGEAQRQATIHRLRNHPEIAFAEAAQPLSMAHPEELQPQ